MEEGIFIQLRIKLILLILDFEFQRAQGNGFSKRGVGKIRGRTSTVESYEDRNLEDGE